MRILIVSDIHANPWALNAVERDAGTIDHVLCAGDTVNYGPDPRPILAWLDDRQAITVQGNHDHAVAFGADPKAGPAKRPLALAMREWSRSQLDEADRNRLARLPVTVMWEIAGCRFALVHATPLDPLYDYRLTPYANDALLDELTAGLEADVLVTGHTHLPFLRRWYDLHVVNPGSVGQPIDGDVRAAYALWEDGHLTLRRAAYDSAGVMGALRGLPLAASLLDDLIGILRTARLDKARTERA